MFNRFETSLICLTGFLAFLTLAAPAQDKEKAKGEEKKADPKPIYDKRYTIFEGEKKMGTYTIRAEEDKKAKQFKTLALLMIDDYRGKKVEMKASVTYGAEAPFAPKKAKAETLVNSKVCMKGTLALSDAKADFECTGFLNKRTEEKIDPPKVYAKKGQPIPDGPKIFQSALPLIGPKLLPKAGELKDIVWVEFPDDVGAPELVQFKEGYRLVRDEAEENGEFVLTVYESAESDDPVATVRYSKDGKIVSLDTLSGPKMVEDKDYKKK